MKKLLSYLLMLAMLLSAFAPTVFAATETTPARGDVSYGERVQFTEDHTIKGHTEIAVTGFQEVNGEQHAIAMVTVNGVNDEGKPMNITSIIDLEDEEILESEEHSYGGYAYHGDTTSDGRMILGAGRDYIQYNPKTQDLTHLGTHITAESGVFGGFVIDEEKNMIYSTESEYGYVNATDLTTGKCTTIAKLGAYFRRGSQIAQNGDYLYTSGLDLTGDTAKIFKIGKTKEGNVYKVEELSPDSDKYKNFNYTFDIGKYIVTQGTLRSGGTKLFAYDTVNGTWQTLPSDIVIGTSMVTTATNGERIFKNTKKGTIYKVGVSTDGEIVFTNTSLSFGSQLRGTGPWVQLKDQENMPGYSFVTAHYDGWISAHNFETKQGKKINVTISKPSVKHRISYLNPMDGILWIGGYKGGTVPFVNTKTGKVKSSTGSQPEGMIHDPATGLFYHGDYTDAKIYEKDTTKPDSSENVREYLSYSFGSLENDQDRPFDLEVVGRELYIASMPKASTPDPGALSWINLDTEEKTVWQGIVSGQSLITLTSKGKYLYFGTSVTVGSGQPVSEDPAQVVMFDTETKKIVKQVPLVIPDVTGNLAAVKGLQISPDGKTLYGFTNGIYFTMDAETLEITNSKIFGTYYVNAKDGDQHWHNTKIYVEKNTGYLIYGDALGGTIVDPDTLEIVTEAPGYGWFCGVDENSDAWFVKGTKVYKAHLNVEKKSYTLSKVEPIDPKTLKLTLNKEFTGNMVGDIVKYTDGKNATSVVMQSVSGNSVTVTLASELDMETKYTIKPVGTSTDFEFDFEAEADTINWSLANGSITIETARGSDAKYRIYHAENDIFESFTGDGQGKFEATRYKDKQYNGKRGHRLKFKDPMTDKFVASFYFKRGSDNVTGIHPILESYYGDQNENERSKNPSIIDIKNNGAVEINGVEDDSGTVLGNVGFDEWHYFQLVYEPSASENVQYYLTIYLDGVEKGRYKSSKNVAGGPIVALGVYSTEYVSDAAVAATGDSVAARKSSHSYIKGFNVTNDLTVVNELKVANVKAEANRVIFTMTQEVADVVPEKEDITITQGDTEIEVLDVEPYRDNENKLVRNAFVVTLDGPKNNAEGTAGTYTIDIKKEFSYVVTLGDDEFTGTYTESFGHTFEDFNDEEVTYTSNVSNAVGTVPETQIKWLEGKYQGDGDFALGFTSSKGAESTGSTYDKNAYKYSIQWADYDTNIQDTKYVVSVDFMRGSERVHGAPIALERDSSDTPNLRPIKLETNGDLIFSTETIATGIGAGEWHNVTMHIQDVNGISLFEIYVDGKHVYGPSNYDLDNGKSATNPTDPIYGIRSVVRSAEPTVDALKKLDCSHPERMDIMLFDNFYIGQDFTYKTSDITLRERSDGTAIVLDSCGGVDRDNPLISALYSQDGKLKDLRIHRLRNAAFDGTSWTGAHKAEEAETGDIIKVFAVNDFINLRPISNVFTKEVSKEVE